MSKAVSTTLTAENITRVTALLANAPAVLERLSAGITTEQLHQPLGAGERSFIEVFAHLLNSEARTAESIYLALLVDEPLLASIHPERELGKLLRFELLEFPRLLGYFNTRRAILLRVLSSLTEEQWARTIREDGKARRESVYWRARSLALHESEHLADLERRLVANRMAGEG